MNDRDNRVDLMKVRLRSVRLEEGRRGIGPAGGGHGTTERMVVQAADREGGHQAITPWMRLAHRLSAHVPMRKCTLGNDQPLLSITFDDIPDSAATVGAAIIEEARARSTFYVATSLFGRQGLDWRVADRDAVSMLAARGHEIGLHSHAHRPVAYLTPGALAADVRRTAAILADLVPGGTVENYAYPYGFSAPQHRHVLRRFVRSSRTTHPGINGGRVDLDRLASHTLGNHLDRLADVERLLDETMAKRGWLILTTHDVAERPSPYGCSPSLLRGIVAAARGRGMPILSVDAALDACGVPRAG